ncbi:hypothetical protein [Leptolyngbya ohadii]|uniref:hypothetical protein n=1 Tax=Leptolyngbya ohadii TaxID=1962290 RepID=UPI0015C658AC|nr:hypothetical protein [Leptolyngbya ohadii]
MVHLLYALSSLAQYVEQYAEQRSIAPGQFTHNIRFALPFGNWMRRSVQRFNRSY